MHPRSSILGRMLGNRHLKRSATLQGHSGFSPRYQGWGLIDAGGAGPGIGRRVGAIFCTFWTRLGGDLLPPQVDLCKWRRVRDTRMFRAGLVCDFDAISTIKGLASARINRFKNTLRRSDLPRASQEEFQGSQGAS